MQRGKKWHNDNILDNFLDIGLAYWVGNIAETFTEIWKCDTSLKFVTQKKTNSSYR